jgi:glycerophosphoryl diester phosphodiesterase
MLVIAHRGANKYAPQNTLEAFDIALGQNADGVETDVRTTKDGHLVLCHNSSIKATSDGRGKINEKYLGELFNYDFGSWFGSKFKNTSIATFDDFLQRMKQGGAKLIDIEIKRDKLGKETVERIISKIKEYNLEAEALISSFDGNLLSFSKRVCPEIRTGFLYPFFGTAVKNKLFDPVQNALKNSFDFLLPHRSFINEDLVKRAHAKDIKVMPWTVNDISLINKYSQWGVDGVITDYPDIMIHKLEIL